MQFVFVTGAARSGTTLVDRMLNSLASTVVASQPMPGLYAEWKKEFFSEHPGCKEPFPHHHHFPFIDGWYEAFASFLAAHEVSPERANSILTLSLDSKGQDNVFLRENAPHIEGGTFIQCWRSVHAHLLQLDPAAHAAWTGSKEIYCEDFVPTLLAQGIRCVIVVRDPRDVLTSMNHGHYLERTRKPYPLLLNIRNWRKSAAYWLSFRTHPLALCLKYEDVTRNPTQAFSQLAKFLDTQTTCNRLDQLRDEAGNIWNGNSSFNERPDGNPRWRTLQPDATLKAIETLTWPEMLALGYEPSQNEPDFSQLSTLREPADSVRVEYLEGNELSAEQCALEEDRFRYLTDNVPGSEQLVMPTALASLTSALRHSQK